MTAASITPTSTTFQRKTQKARSGDRRIGVSGPDYLDWKRESQSFQEMVTANGSSEYGFNLTTGGEPERVLGGRANTGFLKALGVIPVMGRDFTQQDAEQSAPVAIISESMATRFFPGEDPLGQRIKRGSANAEYPWATIVGIAADVKHSALAVATCQQRYRGLAE